MRRTYRTALITGASRGIGRSLALQLARGGTLVVVCARGAAALEAVVAEIAAAGGRARAVVLDVADCEETARRIRALDAELGGLDLIVANAGVGAGAGAEGEDAAWAQPYAWETVRAACHVNYCGGAATLTAVLPQMVARGRGHVVGISSISSYGALPGSAAYCSPKAGLSMLLACLRLDTAGTGVAVTAVHLGFVRTAMVAKSTHPMPLLLEPDDAARTILRRLPSGPARIDFPRPLHWLARALAALPEFLREPLARLGRPRR